MKDWQINDSGTRAHKRFPYPGGVDITISVVEEADVFQVWVRLTDQTYQPGPFLSESCASLEESKQVLIETATWWDENFAIRTTTYVIGGGREEKHPEYIIREYFNCVVQGLYTIELLEWLATTGGSSGGEDSYLSLRKWDEDVSEDYEVEPYEGYMAYLGDYEDEFEYFAYYDDALVMRYIVETLDWYELRYPHSKADIERLRGLFQCESLLPKSSD